MSGKLWIGIFLFILAVIAYNYSIAAIWTRRKKRDKKAQNTPQTSLQMAGGMFKKLQEADSVEFWLADAGSYRDLSDQMKLIRPDENDKENE